MEEGKSMEQQQQQQQQLLIQQQLQQQRQQQMQMLMMQRQQQQQHLHHQQQQQAASISRFPAAARSSLNHPPQFQSPPQQQQQQIPNSPNPNHHQNLNPNPVSAASSNLKVNRSPPQAELQLAYQDLFKVCHPDHKRPFSSLEDACERLLPYHVVADYEAEEDDRILDSDTTGQMMSRSQQWDHNIAAKVAEFTATFEKQVHAFNIISRKRAHGEFRSEERLMIEKNLLQEQRRSLAELRAEWESRQKAGRDAHEASLRMAAMAAEQARAESQAHAEMMARGPIRQNALGSQGSNVQISNDVTEQEQEVNPEEMINGWGNNAQRDEKEPSEDFLNDDETDNGDAGTGEFDLNTR